MIDFYLLLYLLLVLFFQPFINFVSLCIMHIDLDKLKMCLICQKRLLIRQNTLLDMQKLRMFFSSIADFSRFPSFINNENVATRTSLNHRFDL